MPTIAFRNTNQEWVAVRVRWGATDKNFTLPRGSSSEIVKTGGGDAWFAWQPKNESISNSDFDSYKFEVISDSSFNFGDPPEGRVPT